jgi:hypothetical protein
MEAAFFLEGVTEYPTEYLRYQVLIWVFTEYLRYVGYSQNT